ncbi:NAD(P)H-dependent oxidoreductase [Paracoccus caeni]|uniref:NAD(P)H-dependent oxidoreductase n=1 Tax=Paracoccus caeni TaxID=657651 RepID=A0A934VZK3_9RHOB|nr:NAD(P)H-dependent oxidoreductase [Paracoccus caeni]MBK4215388.1 NAD(P)H-dependent oxidoreductase [Paracoccus caeni]
MTSRNKIVRIAGFAGSLNRNGKTRALVDMAVQDIAARFGVEGVVHDIGDLQPGLTEGDFRRGLSPVALRRLDTIFAADALVIGSAVFRDSYSPTFRRLFDLIDPATLAGKPVLLALAGGEGRHDLVIEHRLRPLFAATEAEVLPVGVHATALELRIGEPPSMALRRRLAQAVAQFAPYIESKTPRRISAA